MIIVIVLIYRCQIIETLNECRIPVHNCECGDLNRADCNNCTNCRYCMTTTGNGACVADYNNGSNVDCSTFEYMNPKLRCNLNQYGSYHSYEYAPEW